MQASSFQMSVRNRIDNRQLRLLGMLLQEDKLQKNWKMWRTLNTLSTAHNITDGCSTFFFKSMSMVIIIIYVVAPGVECKVFVQSFPYLFRPAAYCFLCHLVSSLKLIALYTLFIFHEVFQRFVLKFKKLELPNTGPANRSKTSLCRQWMVLSL